MITWLPKFENHKCSDVKVKCQMITTQPDGSSEWDIMGEVSVKNTSIAIKFPSSNFHMAQEISLFFNGYFYTYPFHTWYICSKCSHHFSKFAYIHANLHHNVFCYERNLPKSSYFFNLFLTSNLFSLFLDTS
jgi:hypothetical protein